MWVRFLNIVLRQYVSVTSNWHVSGEKTAQTLHVANVVPVQTQTHEFLWPCNHYRPLSQNRCGESISGYNLTSVRVGVSIETKHTIHTVCSRERWALKWTVHPSYGRNVKGEKKNLIVEFLVSCLGDQSFSDQRLSKESCSMIFQKLFPACLWEGIGYANPNNEKPWFSCILCLLPSSHPPPGLLHNTLAACCF